MGIEALKFYDSGFFGSVEAVYIDMSQVLRDVCGYQIVNIVIYMRLSEKRSTLWYQPAVRVGSLKVFSGLVFDAGIVAWWAWKGEV